VSITLSSTDIEGLQRVAGIALSPFDFETTAEWGDTLLRHVADLLGADQSLTSITDAPGTAVIGRGAFVDEAMQQYVAYYHALDTGLQSNRVERRLEVYDQSALYGGDPESDTFREFDNDWLRPNSLRDALGIGISIPNAPLPAAIHLYHDSDARQPFGRRGVGMLQLLLPAFKAGVRSQLAVDARRSQLCAALDDIDRGFIIVSARGSIIHVSSACGRLLASDREHKKVRDMAVHAAGELVRRSRPRRSTPERDANASLIREVRTSAAWYRLSPALLGSEVVTRDACAIVAIETVGASPMTNDALRGKFRLTMREIEVARLIAAGKTNREVADALSIRPNTAWRHTERVLAKLGVHTRSAVGPAMAE
jgi:DNA-binding CsgD family transcriptional regulator